jgi:hypothetical protein
VTLILIAAAVLAGVGLFVRHLAQERRADEQARQSQQDPQVLQQRAMIEARTTLNVELLPDDGTFFPATGDLETGSLLYTVHLVGPAKQRYYSEDAYFAGRAGDLVIVRPILEKQRPGAAPQNYRNQQSRSAEAKREEVKTQKKITQEELAEKYAARAGQ